MNDITYKLFPNIVSGQTNVSIYRDGEFVGDTPTRISVSLKSVADNGGSQSFTAEKTNYKTSYQYKVFLIENPDFRPRIGRRRRDIAQSRLDAVLKRYGNSARNFNSRINVPAPNDLYSRDGIPDQFTEFRGNPGDRDSYSSDQRSENEERQEFYSLTDKYTLTVVRYIGNDIDESYLHEFEENGKLDITIDFDLKEEQRNTRTSLERFITINQNIPSSVKVVLNPNDSNSTTQELLNTENQLQVLDKTLVRVVSNDINKYRITTVSVGNVATSGRNGLNIISAENDNESVIYEFVADGNEVLNIRVEELITVSEDKPIIELSNPSIVVYEYNSNSTQKSVNFAINKITKVDRVRAVVGENVIPFSKLGDKKSTILRIPTSYFSKLGTYKINLIPYNEERGDGEPIQVSLNVVSKTFVGVPDIRRIKYPEEIQAPDFVGFDVEFPISYESIDTDYVNLTINGSSYTSKISSTGKVSFNFLDLLSKGGIVVDGDATSANITLGLTPVNTSGIEPVIGKTETLTIKCLLGPNQINKSQVGNRFMDAFVSQIVPYITNTDDDSSKLLTHNLNVGNGENRLISNWVGSEGTLIAKLYEPLPTSIQENQQVWISKLQSNPIVETISLSSDEEIVCSPLKGPNFLINQDKESLGFRVYDELIASGSATSDLLINKYFDGLNIDTTKLDIQYTSGSTYLFENFVNFGSAEERVNNFFYKIQLLETYVDKLNSLTDGLELGQILTELEPAVSSIDGYQTTSPVLFTEDEVFNLEAEQRVYRNPNEKIEADKVINNLRTLLKSFDGFENFLYSSTNELAYPKVSIPRPVTQYPILVLKNSLDPNVVAWYESLVSLSAEYDKNNINYIVNNIPLFVKEDSENSEFLLFLDMIGQHFDVIWVYINSLKKLRKNDEAGIKGVPKEFVHSILKSFGWDGLRAYDSQFLWEYALGQTKEGQQKYSTSLEDANNQIWKRILNNLPYLLKHKGTARAMKAIMATYGVPQTMLTIMEFGGPQDPTESGTTDFTFDDRTCALHLYPTASVDVHWKDVDGEYPNSIEFMLKPHNLHSSTILSSSNFTLDIVETGSKVYLEFDLNGETTQSSPFQYSTEDYSGILVSRTSNNYEVLYKTSDGERVYVESSLQLNTTSSVGWVTESVIKVGNDFTGALDEFRLWRVPLEESKFENHVLYPNSINGNSYTASTADLLFRLDFEYPIDVFSGTSTVPSGSIKNVSINTSYGLSYATSSNFNEELSTYPYSYIPYDRTVTTKVPSLGYNYSNKIRSEEQTLISNLSHKKRATKKAFDRAPIDSNRLGLFFSPVKELNMDIIKSLGDFNIDNYIGNPGDEYKDDYSELSTLRNYYFERIDRNSHEYIRLIKYISKSLFDVLESLAPARAKVSKGLLIEPHFLERSKTKWERPVSLRNDFVGEVTASEDTVFVSENQDYRAILNVEDETILVGEEKVYDGLLNVDEETTLSGDDNFFDTTITEGTTSSLDSQYLTYTSSIRLELTGSVISEYDALENFTQVGMDPNSLSVLGFGLFAEDTTTIWKRFNKEDNTLTSSRSDVYLLEETLSRSVPVQVGGYPTIGSVEGDQVVFDVEDINYVKKTINILPYGSTEPALVGNVTKVTPLKGYFPTHYRFTNGLSTGLERSFYEGSKQTTDTTPDGLSPVETFETNPNILRVADTGRGSGEPILEVD